MYTISVDTGGTFTDVVVVDRHGHYRLAKALTTRDSAYAAIESALNVIAPQLGITVADLLSQTRRFNYGTTRSTNAVVEATAARTAFFTTAGFPDILLLREGGKLDPFRALPFGEPYVPRHLTFEIRERIDADGSVYQPLDEESVIAAIDEARTAGVEAIGVCLLWSVANSLHERRIGELINSRAPEIPYTLSHQLNPMIREYRRASATVIDASLKPLMQQFFHNLERDLQNAGFAGHLFISTSYGGSWTAADIAERPVYSIGSGPSMAPVAAVYSADRDLPGGAAAHDLLVADTGGTTFDVGLVRRGQIEQTTETWLGGRWVGNITGTTAVDVKSIGAGGGSIAWIDSGGLLRVGPRSAGSNPGPACYGLGGSEPTVTDAAMVLGYLNSDNFMNGSMELDVDRARTAYANLGTAMGMSTEQAALAALTIAADNIVTAVRETTIARGIDPREVTIVAGGGGSGLNIGRIAAELGTAQVLLPSTAGAMSACGALLSDIISEFSTVAYAETLDFQPDVANSALQIVRDRAEGFLKSLDGEIAGNTRIEYFVEARYRQQAWELPVPLHADNLAAADAKVIEDAFHVIHRRNFGVHEPGQYLELLTWKARAIATLAKPSLDPESGTRATLPAPLRTDNACFDEFGWMPTKFFDGSKLPLESQIVGPAVIQEPTTTLVIYPGQSAAVTASGNYLISATTVSATSERI